MVVCFDYLSGATTPILNQGHPSSPRWVGTKRAVAQSSLGQLGCVDDVIWDHPVGSIEYSVYICLPFTFHFCASLLSLS